MSSTPIASTVTEHVPAQRGELRREPDTHCHCGEAFEACRGCGAARCPGCEPVRDEDCLFGV